MLTRSLCTAEDSRVHPTSIEKKKLDRGVPSHSSEDSLRITSLRCSHWPNSEVLEDCKVIVAFGGLRLTKLMSRECLVVRKLQTVL